MKNSNGVTIVELLVSILISAILILMIGVLTTTANRSFRKARDQQSVYNDLSYGFKLLQAKVRAASSALSAVDQGGAWISGQHFLIGSNAIFGLCTYKPTTVQCDTTGTETALVYYDGFKWDTILRVPSTGSIALSFPAGAPTSASVTIRVSGAIPSQGLSLSTTSMIPFSMQTTATRRNL